MNEQEARATLEQHGVGPGVCTRGLDPLVRAAIKAALNVIAMLAARAAEKAAERRALEERAARKPKPPSNRKTPRKPEDVPSRRDRKE